MPHFRLPERVHRHDSIEENTKPQASGVESFGGLYING
jgi:hypothetical protein